MRTAIGLMILLTVLGCSAQLNDAARRDHLLMPKVDSPAHKEWVAKYGDSADSWELFTISFQTRYIQQLTAQVAELKAVLALYPDPNDIVCTIKFDPNELVVIPAEAHREIVSREIVDPNGTTTKTN